MSQMSRKPSYDPAWQEKYSKMITTAEEAVSHIRPGQRVFIGTGCAQPQELVRALTARSYELADTQLVHLLTMGDAPYAHKELSQYFSVNSFFISDNVRDIIQEGLGQYTPIFLSDIPGLFDSGQLPLDAALIHVSPPDERGMVSLGISVDIVKSAAENAALVIAQVNPRMPRTLGDSFLSVHDLDYLVPVDAPLLEAAAPEPDEVTRKIGEYVAGLVEDGSTLELGIGRIPHAVLEKLGDKQDLGIHTEMLNDAIIDMVESGVVSGRQKSIDRGKVVASFCTGTRRLYDYIDNNPVFAFHPTEYVNDPFLIAQQHKMVAINVALEIDLTGQVCADSLGTRFFSGIGGQVDFNRGAARAEGGKAIIALPSTAKGGSVSRIVAQLSAGAGVVTTRGDVYYVVTEYGVAYLHGKSVGERALALIGIAHPSFREELLHRAIEFKLLRPEMADVEGKLRIEPPEMRTTYLLDDGTQINFRPMLPTDEPRFKDLFYALSQQTVYYRFMSHLKRIPLKQIQNFVYVDHRNDVAIAGTVPEAHGDEIVAIGRYYLDPQTNRAEVAFVVRDEWQGRGIGKFLLRYLATIARRNGIRGFTAETLRDNKAMQAVFYKSGFDVKSRLNDDVYSFTIDFA
ncbi:MAG: GNAT family N-acetyltransferase [Deltaproteobacteria bacterium]|nr:GNAT family N-acetyltransferase [Deltaproteobacteria bacterium]